MRRAVFVLAVVSSALLVIPGLNLRSTAAGSLPEPPRLKWSSAWIPFQTGLGYSQVAFVLPGPVRGATLGVLAWFRTEGGLYTPGVKLFDGSNGSIVAEHWGLPAIFPLAADVIDADQDGRRDELIVSDFGGVLGLDLESGATLWHWTSPQLLAGPPAVVAGPIPLVIAVTWVNGTVFAIDPVDGTVAWTAEGVGNRTQLTAPLVVESDGQLGVVAAQPARVDDAGALVAPPELRLVSLETHEIAWRVPLRHNATAIPVLVPSSTGLKPDVVFFDNDMVPPGDYRALAVSAMQGVLRWEVGSQDLAMTDPFSPVVIVTASGPWVLASSTSQSRENASFLSLDPTNGAARQAGTACKGEPTRIVPVDLTRDGFHEVIMATRAGWVCVFSIPNLELLWNGTFRTEYVGAPALGDIDGDGAPEFVTVSNEGYVDAFDLPGAEAQPPGFDPTMTIAGVLAVVIVTVAILALWSRKRRRKATGIEATEGIHRGDG